MIHGPINYCSKCLVAIPRRTYRCAPCHAAEVRAWRKTHPLTAEQRRKDNARSYLGTYVRRGKITKQPCEVCGATRVHGHHEDYSKPLQVNWLCPRHHRLRHIQLGTKGGRRGGVAERLKATVLKTDLSGAGRV